MNQATVIREYLPIGKIQLSPKNPRKISRENLDELKKSIEKDKGFMERRPLLINRVNGMNVIYAGFQRLNAIKELGWKEAPCFIVEDIPLDQLEYRMLLDNVEMGEWDEEKLSREFSADLQASILQFVSNDPNIQHAENQTDSPPSVFKTVSAKLTFNLREDLNNFYLLMEDLKIKHPELSVSQRLLIYLQQHT